ILLLSPYVVVAAGLMYYNFIRFSSPFDFGSNYQLTTNDVTNRGINMGRTGLGFFTYLFQPPVFTAEFPFLEKVTIRTNYVGKTIYENCFGGLITSTPILLFLALLGKAKNTLKEKKLLSYTLLLILFGFILVFFDAQAGGLLQRYVSDFGFIFFGAAVLIIFALYENTKTESEKNLLDKLTFSSSFLSIFYSFALAFSVSDVTIDTMNPGLFTYLSETVQFWL
ncbi:MAG: cytochrome C oxidase Cbb3, partial [Clostridia bacterium]|nr:cytochrome C oxidase Cbb3 [Clostridia bacterium]